MTGSWKNKAIGFALPLPRASTF